MEYIQEHMVGFIILAANILLTTAFIIYRIVWWKKRWAPPLFGGHYVRFAKGVVPTPNMERELTEVVDLLDQIWSKHSKFQVYEPVPYRIEVVKPGQVRTPSVPNGVLGDGSKVGGSIRTERMFPITTKHHVAVVVDERTGPFVAHEVARHIFSVVAYGEADAQHKRVVLADVEADVKANLKVRLA